MLTVRNLEYKLFRGLFNANIFSYEEMLWMDELPKNKSIINCILLLKDKIDIRDLRNVVSSKLIYTDEKTRLFPRLRQYIYSGFVNEYWIDEKKFLISQHVYEWNNVAYDSKEDLKNEMSIITTKTFGKNSRLSPWEFLLLHYKENDETRSAIIFRSHHSLADGASFVYLLLNELNSEEDNAIKQIVPRRHFDENNSIMSSVKSWIHVPLVSAIQFMLPTPNHDLHCARVSEKKMVAWSEPLSLPHIKSIKEKLDVSINDVVVGCLATNIHNFFKNNDKVIPTEIMASLSVNANCDFNDARKNTNKFAVISVPIPTSGDDILQNVLEISQRMNNIKSFNVPNTYRTGYSVYDACLPKFFNTMLRNYIAKKSSMVLSNVPGPQKRVQIGSVDVDMICFWPPQKGNVGMACTIFSYMDTITVGFSCDKALNVNPYELVEGLPRIVNRLAESLCLPRVGNDDSEDEGYDYICDVESDDDLDVVEVKNKRQIADDGRSFIKDILVQQGVSRNQLLNKRH